MTKTTSPQVLLGQVLEAFAAIEDPRRKRLVQALVRHLHEFAAEVELAHDEWEAGIRFLTACGKKSDETRQEFILLSDVLGLSSLVEMLGDRGSAEATEATVLGPFYVPGSVARANGESTIVSDTGGPRLFVHGTVRDDAGRALAGATVDVWQAASNGLYPVQDATQDPMNLRGVFTTDEEGRYAFVTLRPIDYSVPTDGPVGALLGASGRHSMRAAHLHLIVGKEGFHPVTTHLFDASSPHLGSDAVFGVRDSLIREFRRRDDATLETEFDVTLTPLLAPVERP
jgi:protocatechuate 3,4-dioxygenase beta subunit